jgi:hypothetical protein
LAPVYRSKNKKAILLCTGFFSLALVLQLLIIFRVELPRYADIFLSIFNYITGKQGE